MTKQLDSSGVYAYQRPFGPAIDKSDGLLKTDHCGLLRLLRTTARNTGAY